MKSPAFILAAFFLLAGNFGLFLKAESFSGVVFSSLLSLGPLYISLVLAAFLTHQKSQIILCVASSLFSIWFTYVYLNIFYWDIDAQGGVALIFVGLISLPVMIPLWLIAYMFKRQSQII